MSNDEPQNRRTEGTDQTRAQRRSRAKAENTAALPVSLTQVVITVSHPGILTVTVNGKPFQPIDAIHPWTRATIGDLLDAVTEGRRIPVRVEVHESDGSTFTDLIHTRPDTIDPTAPDTTDPDATRTDPATEAPKTEPLASASELVEVAVSGFLAGEEIALAVVVAASAAGPDGIVHVRLESTVLCGAHEIVVLGRISGNNVVQRLS